MERRWVFFSNDIVIFAPQCDAAGHIVCFYCRAGHGDICSRASTHCAELDAVVSAAKVPCTYRAFGCDRYVVYHEASTH